MKKIIHKYTIWPLSLLLLFAFVQVGNAGVLCIGEDGHIEIESKCLPCCNEASAECELTDPVDLHEEHDDCNNCSDLSLRIPFGTKRFYSIANFKNLNNLLTPAIFTAQTSDNFAENQLIPFVLSNKQILKISKLVSTTVLRC